MTTQPDYAKMDSSYGASLTRDLLGLSPQTPLFGTNGQIIIGIRDLKVERDRLRAIAVKMVEVLEDLAMYPVARGYPDGPCLDRVDMNAVEKVLSEYRELFPPPQHL